MKHTKHIGCIVILLLFFGRYTMAQTLNFANACAASSACNPYLNGYSCAGGFSLQTTHGSPDIYDQPDATAGQVELLAEISSSGVGLGEGFTIGYPFKSGHSYTINISYIGSPATAGGFPFLDAALVSNPPRDNDGCDLGSLPTTTVYSSVQLSVNASQQVATWTVSLTQDVPFLWLLSQPLSVSEEGVLVTSVQFTDNGTFSSSCYNDPSFNFCSTNNSWNGSANIRSINTLTLSCDAFTTASSPASGTAFARNFTAPSILLEPGFYASTTDPLGAIRSFEAIPSSTPCTQALRTTGVISDLKIVTVASGPTLPGKLTVYPSPSNGVMSIAGNKADLSNAVITVIDQSGRTVYTTVNKSESNVVPLNLQHLANGVYFVQIRQTSKTITRKIVIQK